MSTSCEHCTVGFILPGEPTGTLLDSYGPQAYHAAAETPSKRAIILLTDIFGLPLKNSKILADRFSKELGCDVYVPDLFNGSPPFGPTELSEMPERVGDKMGIWKTLKVVFTALWRLPGLLSNRPGVVDERVDTFITKLQADKHYEKLGAVGYCFGGGCAARLATKDLVHASVMAHPSPISAETTKAMKVPVAFSCAEEDMSFNEKHLLATVALLEERKGKDNFVEYDYKIYKGTTHGFAARPNLSYPEVKEGFEGAFKQTVDFFNKVIPQ